MLRAITYRRRKLLGSWLILKSAFGKATAAFLLFHNILVGVSARINRPCPIEPLIARRGSPDHSGMPFSALWGITGPVTMIRHADGHAISALGYKRHTSFGANVRFTPKAGKHV